MPIVECKQVLESLPHNQSSSWCKAWPKQDHLQDDINSPPYFLAKNIVIPEQNVHQDNVESILYEIPHFKTSSGLQKKTTKTTNFYSFPAITCNYITIFHYLVPRLFSEVTSWRITKRTRTQKNEVFTDIYFSIDQFLFHFNYTRSIKTVYIPCF